MERRKSEPLPAWQPWAAIALFAFLLNFPWEMLQVPFFRGMADAPHWRATLFCLRATGGDVVIMVAAYASVAWRRGRDWLVRGGAAPVGRFIGIAFVISLAVEALSVHAWSRWAYSPAMPVILGVGLLPLLQWILLPPAALWLARRHLEGAGG